MLRAVEQPQMRKCACSTQSAQWTQEYVCTRAIADGRLQLHRHAALGECDLRTERVRWQGRKPMRSILMRSLRTITEVGWVSVKAKRLADSRVAVHRGSASMASWNSTSRERRGAQISRRRNPAWRQSVRAHQWRKTQKIPRQSAPESGQPDLVGKSADAHQRSWIHAWSGASEL